jgi:MPBQ/MSBQ methyltransferase
MAAQDNAQAVDAHYTPSDLDASIFAALRAAGKDPEAITPDDLAPVDHFHIGGKAATEELARLVGLHAGESVLDVGGGLGGPARTLALQFGCHVTVLDLTEEFCRVGALLTAHTGLSEQVAFRHGNALDMPFPDASFDVVWTQHSSMNIAEKERLYAEIHRALRPGGRLAFHEIMAGPVQPIHFPVPWANDPSISFLESPEAVRALLRQTGFRELAWVDATAPALEWFRAWTAPSAPAPLGLHLLLGPDFRDKGRNQERNLEEQRIAVIQGVFTRD